MIKTYSLKRDGDKQLSKNFKVREFACKDGSDYIIIDDALITALQEIRDNFGRPVTITSGYRNAAYNKRVGGASNSQHIYGKAADIVISGVSPESVAVYADAQCLGGVGLYKTFTHVDTRAGRSRWDDRLFYTRYPDTFIPTPLTPVGSPIKEGERGERVVWLQVKLNKKGYGLTVDGIFGSATDSAVRRFQLSKRLVVDGLVGKTTISKL